MAKLESGENLTEIKSWGGKRSGAGRTKQPYSRRSLSATYGVSTYMLRRAETLREIDRFLGTDLSARVRSRELKLFEAIRLGRDLVALRIAEGEK
jgi:hypothetical protein